MWAVYAEDPDVWHALGDSGLLCGNNYHLGDEGPYPEPRGTVCMVCRRASLGTKTVKFKELTDEELSSLDADALREVYKDLRSHHINETTALIKKVRNLTDSVRLDNPLDD